MAFEGVWRQHAVNSDINTPFNSIPLPSANEGHVSELNFSGRQSRLSVLVAGDAGSYKLSGYWEMDFLGTGTSSNNNQSNSYVLRQRQIWGKAETQSGFTVTGGQMWSLVTEDAKGTDARTEIQPLTIDPQYLVGYSWTRQPGIRVAAALGAITRRVRSRLRLRLSRRRSPASRLPDRFRRSSSSAASARMAVSTTRQATSEPATRQARVASRPMPTTLLRT